MENHRTIMLADIDAAEGAVKNIRVKLQAIGREIYKMREARELGCEYDFERYSRENYAGSNYYGQEGPNWGVGTPIISLVYYWARGEMSIDVTLPQGWLEQDWRALEAARLDEERAALAAAEKAQAEQAVIENERSRRQTYELLKAEFESPTHDRP